MDQNQQTFMSGKQIAIIMAILAPIIVGAVWAVKKYSPEFIAKQNVTESVTTNPTPVVSMPNAIHTISGIVKLVSPKQVSFELNPFDVRVAQIANTTKIIKVLPKDPQTDQKEAEELMNFLQKSQTSVDADPPIPSPPLEVEATLADIKVGDTVIVTTTLDAEDLKGFTAVQIKVLSK